ncbi:MAG: hypothetical protein R3185_00940 [Candidatus Thermoplasmatota archaeon]|nr:hypothetical protein [Candidatus Thermoplasmatota archaeon]
MGGSHQRALTLVLAAVVALVALPASLATDGPAIQPGASLGGYCTLNFVFDGTGPLTGKTYIGTAGHCVDLDATPTIPGRGTFGTVVWDDDATTDFALIEIDPAHTHDVLPWLLGHPDVPTGTTTQAETSPGDLLVLSGYGFGFAFHPTTRENRTGALLTDDGQRYTAQTLLTFGDSGGPLVHAPTGKALGTVSAYNFFDIPPTTDIGPTVDWILDELAQDGFPVTLRTVSP